MAKDSTIKKGYKQTEIGIIPEDWEVKKLGELVNRFVNGGTPSTKNETYWNGNIPWITGADILNQKVTEIRRYITKDAVKNSATNIIAKGSLLLVSRTGVGKLAISYQDIAISQDFTGIYPVKDKLISEYLFRFFDFNQSILKSQNQGTSIQGITRETLSTIPICLPSISEQTAIAEVLSDTDALIENLEKQITKKKAIKQGTMQQLLTGKKRLPGFSGDWEVKKLGDIGEFKNGINKGKKDFGFGHPFVNLLDIFGISKIFSNSKLGLVNSSVLERKIYELKKGDILFVRSSVKPEGVGLTSLVSENLNNTVYSGFLIRFRDFSILSFEYKAHCFFEKNFRESLIENSTVSANTNINQNALKKLEIKLPPSIQEQIAIAEILSDMDSEIEVLEQKCAKYKQIKQGMMHQLLTGKIRLVNK